MSLSFLHYTNLQGYSVFETEESKDKMGKAIVVVEDEPFLAELLEYLLGAVSSDVTVLRTGTDARKHFQHAKLNGENTPDLVILDLMMPDDDGESIYQDMLKPGSGWITKRPKTIILSAVGQQPVQERLKSAGVDAFITKPFANDELLTEVERLCGT